jgi:hypothetical protein
MLFQYIGNKFAFFQKVFCVNAVFLFSVKTVFSVKQMHLNQLNHPLTRFINNVLTVLILYFYFLDILCSRSWPSVDLFVHTLILLKTLHCYDRITFFQMFILHNSRYQVPCCILKKLSRSSLQLYNSGLGLLILALIVEIEYRSKRSLGAYRMSHLFIFSQIQTRLNIVCNFHVFL